MLILLVTKEAKKDMKVKRTVIQEDFNNFLSREMKAKGLSIRKLAGKAGISASYLSHLKTFNNSIPSNEVLRKIAGALEIDYETILIEAGRAPEDDVHHRVRIGFKIAVGPPLNDPGASGGLADR